MAKCHLKINVYHSSDYISFLIFVYGVYNLFTNFGNMSQKTKCQNCVKQRNPAETKDSGCQKTHKIHTCPDRYLIGRKKTVDPIDGNLSQYCPNAEIHDQLYVSQEPQKALPHRILRLSKTPFLYPFCHPPSPPSI